MANDGRFSHIRVCTACRLYRTLQLVDCYQLHSDGYKQVERHSKLSQGFTALTGFGQVTYSESCGRLIVGWFLFTQMICNA